MAQDTGKFRNNTKDQYYTKHHVAKQCVEILLKHIPPSGVQWIEPSAGTGVFLKCLPAGTDAVGIDIDPKGSGLLKGDFLLWEPTTQKQRVVFGNPPFGRQGSMAKAFLQHAATFADWIAFILPRSFVKPSMSRSIPLHFHCIHSEELGSHSFEVNGNDYDVPCVFQIWEKRATKRVLQAAIKEEGFSYGKQTSPFDFAVKRVGGLAGKAATGSPSDFNPNYHYFISLKSNYKPFLQKILSEMNMHVFPSNTVGPRSLSKSEINEVLNLILHQCSL